MALAQSNRTPATFNRRSLLIAAPAAGVALVAGQAVAGESEIIRLYRRIEELSAAAMSHNSATEGRALDEELDALFYAERDRPEEQMMAIPSTSAADFAAKAIIGTGKGGFCEPWETGALWVEARALIG